MDAHQSLGLFVIKKIINTAIKIKGGKKEKLILGDITIKRDWGYAEEYVEAFQLINRSKLNKDYIKLSIEKARYEDPWELITEANILPYPAFPRKGRLSILGLAIGLIYGSLYASYLENKKDIIYDIKSLESLLNYPILEKLSQNKVKKWDKSYELLARILNKNSYKSIGIYIVDEIDMELVERLRSELSKYLSDIDLKITKDLSIALNLSCIIIIGELGKIKKDSIINFNKNLDLQNKISLGMILITQ